MPDGSEGAAAPIHNAYLDKHIAIGGKTYTLRFSVLAMQAFRQLWNVDTDAAIGARLNKVSVTDLPAYLFALTRSFHPDLSEQDCAMLADGGDMMKLGAVCGECFRAHSAPPKKKALAPVNRAQKRASRKS